MDNQEFASDAVRAVHLGVVTPLLVYEPRTVSCSGVSSVEPAATETSVAVALVNSILVLEPVRYKFGAPFQVPEAT